MLKQKLSSKRGFTIIEVVLVLAIAGLIFLMVFLALPALQRSQRDTQRRDAYSEFLTQISNYQANNRGRLPTGDDQVEAWEKFVSSYLRPTEDCSRDMTSGGGEGSGEEESKGGNEIPTYTGSDCDGDRPTTFLDPVGEPYYIGSVTDFSDEAVAAEASDLGNSTLSWDKNKYKIYVYLKATCDGEKAIVSDGNRNIAIRAKLEGGGVYCGHN